jgi:hypothetical protein
MRTTIQAFADRPDPDPNRGGRLLRALRDGAEHPYVLVDGAANHAAALHAATYEAVREHGDPHLAAGGGVILLDLFVVPPEHDEAFEDAWDSERLTGRGFLGTRLLKATSETDLRYAELARWSSPLMIARAAGAPDHPHALYEAL